MDEASESTKFTEERLWVRNIYGNTESEARIIKEEELRVRNFKGEEL